MTKRRGFFGGSFDPIHLGHLHLALQLFEKHKLDEVFFCPTSQSPHKKENPPIASKDDRRAMVAAAISPLPQFTFLDLELQQADTCYTIDTLRTLVATDEQNKAKVNYFLLLGEDALERFNSWKEVEDVVKLAPPLIGSRGKNKPFTSPSKAVAHAVEKGMTPIPLLEISSTAIRERIGKGLFVDYLLPAKVAEYIHHHKLYKKKS